ncbi:MAG: glycosyltransferase family 39 protein [Flavobacteriales bacterium]|nr:glycosyltransferase family 39 protein [Flavobacteriales bacterium]
MRWREHIARYGTTFFPGAGWVRWTFISLFVLAAVLRFWNYTSIPYTHDEISALVRIYPSLTETIQHGVMDLDTHPPGVQVFEWIWTGLFGVKEHVVKLPFTILALTALFFLFRFAQAWTTSSVALVLIAILATLQYTVMYAQIARPYAMGFFTTALLADQLTRYVALDSKRALIGIGIAALFSAYTHHFSMLLAVLMVGTAFLLIRAEQRKHYMIMCGVVIALYVPNIPIFLHQLGQGGLSEWLAAPDRNWIMDYAWWIAHCSMLLALVLIGTIIGAISRGTRIKRVKGPSNWVLACWGIMPLAIGLAYSVWRAPVIQYSLVLFSFPYIMLLLLKGLGDLDKWITIALCTLLATVSTVTLINERHHFDVFYASKYEAIVQGVITAHKNSQLAIIDAPNEVIAFYEKHWNIAPGAMPHVQMRMEQERPQLDNILRNSEETRVFYGFSNGSPTEQLARIQYYFPALVERHDYMEGQTFVFEKANGSSVPGTGRNYITSVIPGIDPPLDQSSISLFSWQLHTDLPISYDADSIPYWDFTDREYGILIELKNPDPMIGRNDEFEVILEIDGTDSSSEVAVVFELVQDDSTVFYRTGELKPLQHATGLVPLVVAGTFSNASGNEPAVARAYIHNRSKGPIRVRGMEVYRRVANPVQYGMVEPIPTLGKFR